MARFVILDEFREYAEMIATPLRYAGHEVLSMVVEEGPLDFEAIIRFEPQAISVALYRNESAFDRPIEDWTKDVLGYAALSQMQQYPAINVIPIMLIGSCLREQDVPRVVNYILFLSLPRDIKLYVPKMEELAQVKTRRKISEYLCPKCGSRLTYRIATARNLFCFRCHTAVALIDGEDALVVFPDREQERVPMERLMPPEAPQPET